MLLPQLQKRACRAAPLPTHDFGFGLCLVTAWAELDGLTRAEPWNCVTSQLLVPFLANKIRREEKRVINLKRFNLYFAMSTDASLDLGASPVSPVRASESTNVMFLGLLRRRLAMLVAAPSQPLDAELSQSRRLTRGQAPNQPLADGSPA